ncbi:RNA-binding S4 domain-containing protein [Desulforamulus aquiferis]|uniref:RNA-binding S4 domain-containing protein n=1 Tax=Desulforamulus aquiferis TaxID=1397668 RepID=A0AAW7ZCJ7_9FIRM|nr:RNA-binding S4 domain-containing protein [Desulforamulus aquiferis]MDO7787250.1 RNA-binding S4 domain-containing protein [Desulforamulus aquiferis]RYD05610.1 RNA-binding protein S4 [Desulforamulus aquiferis]
MEKIKVDSEIRLDQFLKWANVTGSGGQGKMMVQTGMVKVNGKIESKRGRLLKPNDTVEVEGAGSFLVVM